MGSLLQDFRYGCRMLLNNPGFTAVAVLTLALGIGASTTVFSWIDAVLLHPLPGVKNAGGLVAFETLTPDGEFVTNSYLDYRDYRDHLKLISGLAMTRPTPLNLGEDDHAERVWGMLASGNYFEVLGVTPERGRVFLPEEYADTPGAFPVVVISDRLWRSYFSSDPNIAGKTVRINQHEFTIVGVVPPEFRGTIAGLSFDVWVPFMMQPQLGAGDEWMLRDRATRQAWGLARLNPGVTLQQAQQEIAGLARQIAKGSPETNAGMSATVLPLWKSHFAAQSVLLGPLQVLAAVCVVVLLIVCANVANMLLARFIARQKDFSLRLALGAGRLRLMRQVLAESMLLAAAGAVAGVVMAAWMRGSLRHLLPAGDSYITLDVPFNWEVLSFTILVCLATALLAGAAPALHCLRADLNSTLKESGRSATSGQKSHRLRALLVVSEVSLALVALIAAGLFIREFQATRKINPGFDPGNILLSRFYLNTSGYNLEQRKQFCRRLREKVESEPGVNAVTYSDGVPLGFESSWWEELKIQGYVPSTGENMKIYRNVVAPGYFNLMKIPMIEGRDFTEHDDESNNSPDVMIVSQAFQERFLGAGNPIGRKVHGWGRWFTVVGVAKDSKYHHLTEGLVPYFYVPFRQIYRADMNLAFYVRTVGDPNQAMALLRRDVREIDPNVTIFEALPLSEYIGASLFAQKIAASFLSVLGALALLLAALGLYSVMAYSVTQRTHEIGVRMALGAQSRDVLALVLRRGMALTIAGVLVGAGLALVLTRPIPMMSANSSIFGGGGVLLGGSATDPLIYLAAAAFLAAIAALATYIPARRATKVDPMIALRYE